MIQETRSIKYFEEALQYTMKGYAEGDCDLDAVLKAADKVLCYKANIGLQVSRIEHNPREKAFHEQWLEENAPVAGVNNGHGILQDLFIERDTPFSQFGKVIEEISNRDRMIVATIIQWLGSNVGMCFLQESLARFDAYIAYKKK
jgi:hypothetical protein